MQKDVDGALRAVQQMLPKASAKQAIPVLDRNLKTSTRQRSVVGTTPRRGVLVARNASFHTQEEMTIEFTRLLLKSRRSPRKVEDLRVISEDPSYRDNGRTMDYIRYSEKGIVDGPKRRLTYNKCGIALTRPGRVCLRRQNRRR